MGSWDGKLGRKLGRGVWNVGAGSWDGKLGREVGRVPPGSWDGSWAGPAGKVGGKLGGARREVGRVPPGSGAGSWAGPVDWKTGSTAGSSNRPNSPTPGPPNRSNTRPNARPNSKSNIGFNRVSLTSCPPGGQHSNRFQSIGRPAQHPAQSYIHNVGPTAGPKYRLPPTTIRATAFAQLMATCLAPNYNGVGSD